MLLRNAGYEVEEAADGQEALEKASTFLPAVVITDLVMPRLDGLALLSALQEALPWASVIILTGHGSIETAVTAMKQGAYDYLSKPVDVPRLKLLVEKALEFRRLKEENVRLREELESRQTFGDMIGTSPTMQEIFATIEKVAATDATVLVLGESGTGKELVARAIHRASERAKGPMVTVNCAAIPRDLLESELFGHVPGAFTGAVKDKIGKFVAADGGTIFLDEIGDLSPELQAKLLRVIQEREVEPVGSNRRIAVDIRIIAATNQDLAARVGDGQFREDLYYRLNVVPITIPPLRERREDIPLLVDHFIRLFSPEKPMTIDISVFEALTRYTWPGNVRELENIIKRMTIFARDGRVKLSDLPPEIKDESSNGRPNHSALIESEIRLVTDALKASGWNQSRAALQLGIPRHVLIYRMKKYGIREP